MDSIVYIVSNTYLAPIAGLTILWDVVMNHLRKEERYVFDETVHSIVVNVQFTIVMLFCVAFFAQFWDFISYQFSFAYWFTGKAISADSLLSYFLCWVLADFCYYVYHRTSHETAFLWSMHKFHHQIQNLTAVSAQRNLPALLFFELIIFYTPLALIGFQGEVIVVSWAVSSFFQLWIHSNIGKLPVFEEIFNTPSHHRVHHLRGSDRSLFDKNYGASLMIWDRLFGTFMREGEKIATFGLQKEPIESWDLMEGNFGFIKENYQQFKRMDSFQKRLLMFIKPPGWQREYAENSNWQPYIFKPAKKTFLLWNLAGLLIAIAAYNNFFPILGLLPSVILGLVLFSWGILIAVLLTPKPGVKAEGERS